MIAPPQSAVAPFTSINARPIATVRRQVNTLPHITVTQSGRYQCRHRVISGPCMGPRPNRLSTTTGTAHKRTIPTPLPLRLSGSNLSPPPLPILYHFTQRHTSRKRPSLFSASPLIITHLTAKYVGSTEKPVEKYYLGSQTEAVRGTIANTVPTTMLMPLFAHRQGPRGWRVKRSSIREEAEDIMVLHSVLRPQVGITSSANASRCWRRSLTSQR